MVQKSKAEIVVSKLNGKQEAGNKKMADAALTKHSKRCKVIVECGRR